MKIKRLHHVGIPVHDMRRGEQFYVGVLGFKPCAGKANWLWAGDGYTVHLMPALVPGGPHQPARHFAFEVDRLADVVALLLQHGLCPYQLTGDQSQRHDVTSAEDPLDFGIGTIFVEDPDGNTLEFIDPNRGIFAEILGVR